MSARSPRTFPVRDSVRGENRGGGRGLFVRHERRRRQLLFAEFERFPVSFTPISLSSRGWTYCAGPAAMKAVSGFDR